MKDNIDLLNHLISSEAKSVAKMRNLSKEDKLIILRLQNKLKALEKKIKERRQLIKEYRNHLGSMSKSTHKRTKLIPETGRHLATGTSITQIKLVKSLEK